jgi:hypothetical protein
VQLFGSVMAELTEYGERLIEAVAKDPFNVVLAEIQALNERKRADYTNGRDPWQNFKDSAAQVGQAPGLAAELLIGVKQARLKQLLFTGREANNESVRDSLLDRAVYSVIALAMHDEGLYS